MTHSPGCAQIRISLGAYVLGALDPAERMLVEAHLADCPGCEAEADSLAGLPLLLGTIPAAEAELLLSAEVPPPAPEPSPDLLPALLARAASVRRASRWRSLVAAAAVVVVAVGGGSAVAAALRPSARPPVSPPSAAGRAAWHTVTTSDTQTGAQLTVRYAPAAWGTQMSVRVAGIKPGAICQFDVIGAHGQPALAGSWQYPGAADPAWYPASTSVGWDYLRGFELLSGGHILAKVPAPWHGVS